MTNQESILKFIQYEPPSTGLTAREISGAVQLSIGETRQILDDLFAAREIRLVDLDAEMNLRRYLPKGWTAAVPATEPVDLRSAEQVWSDPERVRALADWKREHPEESPESPKSYEPSDSEIEDEIRKRKVEPLSEAERRDLEMRQRDRTPRNPQQFLKG